MIMKCSSVINYDKHSETQIYDTLENVLSWCLISDDF